MLCHLLVNNVALIEQVEVDFHKGLNIISGETGAGKSIIIDSINFVLGERPGKDFIRSGAENALVEAIVSIEEDNRSVISELESIGIELDEENTLIISRTVNQAGKTTCRINGRTVTIGVLKDVSALLIDVHGQHEHQSILNPLKHIQLLDRFCGDSLTEYKENLAKQLKKYREAVKSIHDLTGDEKGRAAKIDLYQFQKNEIEMAALQKNEEDFLLERKKVLGSSGKLMAASEEALEFLYRGDGKSAADHIAKALDNVRDIAQLDVSQQRMYEMLESVSLQLDDVVADLRHYNNQIEHDPSELNEIELRLDLIYNLKRKYGNTVNEIIAYCESITSQLGVIENSEEALLALNKVKSNLEKEINALCEKMTAERRKNALTIQSQIESVLRDLGMTKAQFKIELETRDEFTANGLDKVEFMISANVGQEIKQLAKIASGGEMSRVMLALKTVLSSVDNIETFIFDEIDTGVSGRTAQQVAEKLAFIANNRQILCITHLPQIAAMADNHLLIEKKSDQSSTRTFLYTLDEEKQVMELARLIGGAKITEATIEAAREMKQMAKDKTK